MRKTIKPSPKGMVKAHRQKSLAHRLFSKSWRQSNIIETKPLFSRSDLFVQTAAWKK